MTSLFINKGIEKVSIITLSFTWNSAMLKYKSTHETETELKVLQIYCNMQRRSNLINIYFLNIFFKL